MLNAGPLDAGVELTATAYAGTVVADTFSHWVAAAFNIAAGVDDQYSLFLCDLTVPAAQVTSVEVAVSNGDLY